MSQQNCGWVGHQLGAYTGSATLGLDNASTLIGRLKARRDELRRLLAAQSANQAELEKVERMLAAAEQQPEGS